MSTTTKKSRPRRAQKAPESGASPRPDPYQQVTETIIGHLENGVVPWRCPWNPDTGKPRNFSSGNTYRGINVMLLGCRFMESPWWLTYRQAQELGGHVRKGEKGAMIVKYGQFPIRDEPVDANVKPRMGLYLKTFTVFNACQIEGVEFPPPPENARPNPSERIERAEAIVKAMPQRPNILEGVGTRACYRSNLDCVEMPSFAQFISAEDYHRVLFHELAHATGHSSRLNRPSLVNHDGFGGENYTQEELVAEMASAFLCMEADIAQDRHEHSAAYLQSWLTVLKSKDHRRWIVQAASQAARAADFILGRRSEDTNT
jgi:antirestriction protein ArdC